jgi:hypothetical protein
MHTDTVNISIRKHEEVYVNKWEYSDMAKECYRFFELFNQNFFGNVLPTPVISFCMDRVTCLGWYRIGRNEIGIKDQINLNAKYLELPKYKILSILLHEMVHEFCDYFGKHGKNNYHNKQFRIKTEELGIPSNTRGQTIAFKNPFVEFCNKNGVDVTEEESLVVIRRSEGKSKLKKYRCGCSNIWAAKRIDAYCRRCGLRFES